MKEGRDGATVPPCPQSIVFIFNLNRKRLIVNWNIIQKNTDYILHKIVISQNYTFLTILKHTNIQKNSLKPFFWWVARFFGYYAFTQVVDYVNTKLDTTQLQLISYKRFLETIYLFLVYTGSWGNLFFMKFPVHKIWQ